MPAAVKNRSLTVDGYRQYHTKTPNAPNNHAPAAKKGLMILWPDRSSAMADNAKASVVTPLVTSTQVAFEVGRSATRSSSTFDTLEPHLLIMSLTFRLRRMALNVLNPV
jgi:hypothetical protein